MARRRRNSAYEARTSGIPFAGSNRAIWIMYFSEPSCQHIRGTESCDLLIGHLSSVLQHMIISLLNRVQSLQNEHTS
jgi:hypothetical protein